MACFDSSGLLSNIGLIHGIRSFEVHMVKVTAVLERGLRCFDDSIRYVQVTAASKDILYSFDAYHPDYFRLRFPDKGSVISMGYPIPRVVPRMRLT